MLLKYRVQAVCEYSQKLFHSQAIVLSMTKTQKIPRTLIKESSVYG
jgi:hypothetical protein